MAGEAGAPPSSGGTGAVSGSGGGGGIPIANAPVELATAVCGKVFECCSEAQRMGLSILGQSEDQCRLAVATFLALYAADIEASVAAGRADYDGEALAGCVAEQEQRACDMLPGLGDIGCAGAVIPLVPLGETCGAHDECIDGYCDGATQATSPTGTCAAKKADGEMCGAAEECEGGACTSTGCGVATNTPICGG